MCLDCMCLDTKNSEEDATPPQSTPRSLSLLASSPLPPSPFPQPDAFAGVRSLSSGASARMESTSTTVPLIVVYVTVPYEDAGKRLAGSIITEKLAACVNRVPGIESVYRRKGKVIRDSEELLIIKTRESLLDALTEHVKFKLDCDYNYAVPEVIALPIIGGNSDRRPPCHLGPTSKLNSPTKTLSTTPPYQPPPTITPWPSPSPDATPQPLPASAQEARPRHQFQPLVSTTTNPSPCEGAPEETDLRSPSTKHLDSTDVVHDVVYDIIQKGGDAGKITKGAKKLKLEKGILLDNYVHRGPRLVDAQAKSLLIHSKRSKRHMSLKQHKKCGSFDLPETLRKFDFYKPMHEMWKEYIKELTKTIPKKLLSENLLSADLHGALVIVAECKSSSCQGVCGIMIQETAETFGLISEDNRFRVVPKAGSVFILQADCWKVTLIGDKLSPREKLKENQRQQRVQAQIR
uniref:Uncharacterized protein n=1 Tax=Leersia perrieri TaxID=77586 RepID=A0A0D9XJ64_9ORYZ